MVSVGGGGPDRRVMGPLRLPEPDDVEAWLHSPLQPPASTRADTAPEGVPSMLSFLPDVPPAETKPLRFRTAREVAEATSDEVEFAAAYLVFGAITELDGRPKAAGKTTFILELVRCVLDARRVASTPSSGWRRSRHAWRGVRSPGRSSSRRGARSARNRLWSRQRLRHLRNWHCPYERTAGWCVGIVFGADWPVGSP